MAAVESTTALVAGHTLAGGMLPSLPWIGLMGAAVFLAGLPVLSGRLRLRWAVPALVVLQLVLHAWLTVLAPMPEMAVSGAMGQAHGSSLGGLLAPHMLLVHVAGALLTALLWELRAQVVDVIVTWARPDLPPLPGASSDPARTPFLPWTVTDLVTLSAPRRGPPVLAGLVPAHA